MFLQNREVASSPLSEDSVIHHFVFPQKRSWHSWGTDSIFPKREKWSPYKVHNLESSCMDDGAHHNWAALAQHVPQRSPTWEDRELPYLHPVYSLETSSLPSRDRVAYGDNRRNALSSQVLEVKRETGLHENRWIPRWPHELPVSTLLPLQLSISSWHSSLWQASPFPCLYCCWLRSIFPLVGLGEYVLTEIWFSYSLLWFVCFEVLLYSPGWPRTHYTD